MPRIQQTNEISISPEKFLNACSDVELYESYILINSPRFRKKLDKIEFANPLPKKIGKK